MFGCRTQIWSLLLHISTPSSSNEPPKKKDSPSTSKQPVNLKNTTFHTWISCFQVSFSSSFQIFPQNSLCWLISFSKLIFCVLQVATSKYHNFFISTYFFKWVLSSESPVDEVSFCWFFFVLLPSSCLINVNSKIQ